MLAWSEHSRVEKQTITTSAGTIAAGANITVGTAFSSAPDSEVMWALTGKKNDEEVTGSAKQYRVMGIDEESGGAYSIAAAFYNDKKYDCYFHVKPLNKMVVGLIITVNNQIYNVIISSILLDKIVFYRSKFKAD